MYACAWMHGCLCVCMHVCMRVCLCVHVCVYVYKMDEIYRNKHIVLLLVHNSVYRLLIHTLAAIAVTYKDK